MEQAQNATTVWYNCGPVESLLASGAPVQVEIGPDIARQLNQQVQIQYGNFATLSSQSQPHIIVAQAPPQDVVATSTSSPAATSSEQEETLSPHITFIKGQPQTHKIKGKVTTSVGERVPCPQCGKTFSCNANLRDHTRLHTGERPFSCSECGMSFAQRSNWRLHMRVHTGERPYMCGICGKTFSRSSHLPGHMRVHTGERPFQCDNCKHMFGSAQALKNHARTHTGEKPFVCDFCRTPFTHSSSLSSHKKRCNGEKRKRGRPLGSGRRSFKNSSGRRGRPKKKAVKMTKRVRVSKRTKAGSASPQSTEEVDSKKEMKREPNERETMLFNGQQHSIKFETSQASRLDRNVMEISVEVIKEVPLSGLSKKEAQENGGSSVVDDEETSLRPNESEGLSILPDDGTVIVEEDMVRAAASAAGLSDATDLHQEAAVTMATLQHGAINLVHHNDHPGFTATTQDASPDTTNTTTWYMKQE